MIRQTIWDWCKVWPAFRFLIVANKHLYQERCFFFWNLWWQQFKIIKQLLTHWYAAVRYDRTFKHKFKIETENRAIQSDLQTPSDPCNTWKACSNHDMNARSGHELLQNGHVVGQWPMGMMQSPGTSSPSFLTPTAKCKCVALFLIYTPPPASMPLLSDLTVYDCANWVMWILRCIRNSSELAIVESGCVRIFDDKRQHCWSATLGFKYFRNSPPVPSQCL